MTRDQATIARLRREVEALRSAWRNDPRTQAAHVDEYEHRRAIEASARKHGATLGAAFRELLAARLVVVDVDRDGLRPTIETARRLVEAWSGEGVKLRRVA